MMSDDTFVYVTYIRTTPEKLWQAITDGDFTEQYWGKRRIQSTWEEGASVRHVRPDGGFDWQGEVLTVDAPKLLAYTWVLEDERTSKVTFKLSPQGPNVRLMLTHEDLGADNMVMEGWMAILSSLKSLLETDEALFFPGWSE